MANAFSHIEASAVGHFRLNFYAAVYLLSHALHRMVGNGDELERTLQQHGFLRHYLDEILKLVPAEIPWDSTLSWWQEETKAWEVDAPCALPLAQLSSSRPFGTVDRLVLMLAALGEEDSRFGTFFESLQSPRGARRVSVALIRQLLSHGAPDTARDGWAVCSDLLEAGLLEATNPEAPRAEWTVRLPAAIWRLIRGECKGDMLPGCRLMDPASFPPIGDLLVEKPVRDRLGRLVAMIEAGRLRTLALRGMPGSEQLQILGSIARTLGLGLAVGTGTAERLGDPAPARAHPSVLGAFCALGRYLPAFVYDLAPGETAPLPALPGYDGPIAIVLGLEGGLGAATSDSAVTLTLPLLSAAQRRSCWRQALGPHADAECLDQLDGRFLLPSGHVRQAAAIAIAEAALNGREIVQPGDIRDACRTLNRQLLDAHAAQVECGGSWGDLVVGDETMLKLRELELRCRHRERLQQHLGNAFANGTSRGVRALLSGASGTGKTLAARILAAELGIDLYRVDLGAVVNKYIGETEKNLHQVLSRAEALDVILLLDEGDSLLGGRTEVKSANDRYANLETNYLLQRLENYQGIVLVTTNAAQNIDHAFQRRMDVVIPFVHPQAQQRRAIWQLHLPAQNAIGADLFEEVVQHCTLTGGQIRNAGLHATLLAVDDGDGIVRAPHLEAAVRSEYRKAGATYPLDGAGATARRQGMAAFLEVMRP
jgi:ATPase family protein associated with various cellular activities (AAA)